MADKLDIYKSMLKAAQTGDNEKFLDYLTDDIEYHYHMTSRPLVGKQWVEKFLNNYNEICADVDLKIYRHAETDDCLFIEGYEEYTDLRSNERVAHPFMGLVQFRDGKVCAWRDYFEMNNPKQAQAATA
jgi:limonene-1,2-epoxide hydrolase